LVTDSTGVLRVGNGTTTDTTYAQLYYRYADDKYYSDAEFTTEVNPTGALTKWDTIEETVDYVHWTNAVFSTIEFTNTEHYIPLADGNYINAEGNYVETIPSGGALGVAYSIMNGHGDEVVVDASDDVWFGAERAGWWGYAKIEDIRPVGLNWYAWLDMSTFTTDKPEGYETTRTGLRLWDVQINSLEPLMTRDEEENINDQGILKYNKAKHRAESLPLPSVDGSTIVANQNDDGKWEYTWQQPQSGIFTFANMAAYNAYTGTIPDNSLVVIEDETGYVMSEDAE
jgi:hypothetical protein